MFYAILGICSNPDCQIFTLGPTEDGSKSINQGRAAHITAASPLGPRYEKTLTKDERRHADNGIWLCIACANLIDEDVDKYPVSLLNSWKAQAQYETYLRVVDRVKAPQSRTAHNATLKRRLQKAVADDAKKFRTQQGWPIIEIELGFRIVSNDHHRVINLAGLCDGLSVNTELLLTSPPGTGKTTTMLQITDKLVELDRFVPLFLPLKEWAHSSADFIDTILTRNSFAAFNRQEILTLAENGEIAVLLDGWNELSSTTKVNAISNVTALRRDFPLLPIITSTRREAMDLPFGGIRADIQALSEQQQLQIAKSVLGTSGHDLLDRAWRTPSIRDIVAIPLYLSVLLAAAPDGALPDTKERLLGLLIEHHEKGTGNNQLREDTQSKHTDFLAALAFEALSQGEIAIADERAKKVIIAEGKRLVELGQIVAASEPMAVLDALVAHHVLIRSEDGLISFQHQQFQEWFASLKVEQLMVAAIDDADAMQVLKSDIFNYPFWEESILFAVDRMSSQEDQQNIVSTCVLGALFVDPMLAAEMVFHLPKATWAKISDDITAFVKRWHRPGMVDRAVGFMIKTGKGEFAEAFWPLASNTDMQVHLSAMRATQPFRIGVMGDNIAVHLSTLDEETKTHVLGELAMNGDVSSMEQAVALAKQDSSSKLRVEVISSLDFRQADRLAVDLLNASNSCVWQSVASKRLLQDIDDSEVILRLTEEQQKFFSEETNPTRLLYYIAHGHKTEDAEEQLAELISRPDFPAREQDIGWSLRQTYQRFPAAVLKGILQRVERGLELPWGADDLLNELPTVDKGKIAKRALEKSKERGEQNDAVKIAGPNTVGKLIDRFLKQNTMLIGSEKQSTQDEMDIYHSTMDRIVDTRFEPFAQAILCKGRVKDLPTITLLADLLSRHMSVDLDKQRLSPEPKTIVQLIELIGGWVEFILASSDANRHDLSEIARVITCFPDECHLAGLTKLLHEDLNRYREARARHLGGVILPEASMSYGHQYRSAFAAIGGKGAVLILEDHLLDDLFGEDAAHGLRDIYDKRTGTKQSSRSFPEFANVEERRTAITTSGKEETAPEAVAIVSAIKTLLNNNKTESELRRAIALGFVAFQMPIEESEAMATELLALPLRWSTKSSLIRMLTNVGHIPSANMILAGIEEWFELAEQETWRRDQHKFALFDWLELLPYSDQPEETLNGFDTIRGQDYQPYEFRKLLYALRFATDESAETILVELAKREPSFMGMHEWLDALLTRQTSSSLFSLLKLLDDGVAPANTGIDIWSVSKLFTSLSSLDAAVMDKLLARYEDTMHARSQILNDGILAETGKIEAILAMLRFRAKQGQQLDHPLRQAIKNAVIIHQPIDGFTNSYSIEVNASSQLRQKLFTLYCDGSQTGQIAHDSLLFIDELHDQYGFHEDEERHPDIDTGVSWPPQINPP